MPFKQLLMVAATAVLVAGQRPFFAGSRPIGYPEVTTSTTTTVAPDDLGNRVGEDTGGVSTTTVSTTTQRLPAEANGDRELIDRLSKLPIDKQPFWFINWQAIEANRNRPQTYPLRPSHFAQPLTPMNPEPNVNNVNLGNRNNDNGNLAPVNIPTSNNNGQDAGTTGSDANEGSITQTNLLAHNVNVANAVPTTGTTESSLGSKYGKDSDKSSPQTLKPVDITTESNDKVDQLQNQNPVENKNPLGNVFVNSPPTRNPSVVYTKRPVFSIPLMSYHVGSFGDGFYNGYSGYGGYREPIRYPEHSFDKLHPHYHSHNDEFHSRDIIAEPYEDYF